MELVKNQHYIPQGYLRKFKIQEGKNKNKHSIYKLDCKKLKIERRNIEKICSGKYFYEVDKKYPTNDIENYIGKNLEEPFFKLIYNGDSIKDLDIFSPKVKSFLAFYLAFQMSRTNHFRELASEINLQAFKGAYHILKEKGIFDDDIPCDKIKFKIDKQLSHLEALSKFPFKEVSHNLLQKKWVILEAKNNSSLTFCACSSGISLDTYRQIHFFPLSSKYCLSLYPLKNNVIKEEFIVQVNDDMINFVNSNGIGSSDSIFASDEKSLEKLKNHLEMIKA